MWARDVNTGGSSIEGLPGGVGKGFNATCRAETLRIGLRHFKPIICPQQRVQQYTGQRPYEPATLEGKNNITPLVCISGQRAVEGMEL